MLTVDVWGDDDRPFEERTWRFSGFCSNGRPIGYEYNGPHSSTQSFPYLPLCRVGRDPERCNFVLPVHEDSVGRLHAELEFVVGRGLGIRDLNSRNRTFVNDREVNSELIFLKVGDTVRFGRLTLRVSYPR